MENTDRWEVGYWNKALMNMELMAWYYANWPKWEIPNAMHVLNTYKQKTDIYTKKEAPIELSAIISIRKILLLKLESYRSAFKSLLHRVVKVHSICIHIVMNASNSCCRFVGSTSIMWITRSTTSKRYSVGLRCEIWTLGSIWIQ